MKRMSEEAEKELETMASALQDFQNAMTKIHDLLG